MKFMNLKRFGATVMATVMALALTVPAFASATTNLTGTYSPITLAVTVPTTGKAIINPYGLPYKLDDTTSISGEQITTGAPLLIQNKSVVALSVDVSITGKAIGTFAFDDDPIEAAETGNLGNVRFQMFKAAGVTETNATELEALNPKFAALAEDDAECDVVIKTTATGDTPTAVTAADILTLKEGTADGELQDGGAAFFRLSGTVAKKPTTAWTKNDGFTVAVVFSFNPTTYAENAGTIAADVGEDATLGQLNTSCDITLTPASGVNVTTWTWSSSDESVATVAAASDTTKATVTRVGTTAGTTTITATGTGANGVTYVASFEITNTANP